MFEPCGVFIVSYSVYKNRDMTLHSSSSNVKVSKLLVMYLEQFSFLTDVTLTSKVVLVADMRRALQLWNTSWSSKRQSIWVCPSRCGGEWYYRIQRYTWLECPQYFSRTKRAVIVCTWWRYKQTELTNTIFPYWETVNTSYKSYVYGYDPYANVSYAYRLGTFRSV